MQIRVRQRTMKLWDCFLTRWMMFFKPQSGFDSKLIWHIFWQQLTVTIHPESLIVSYLLWNKQHQKWLILGAIITTKIYCLTARIQQNEAVIVVFQSSVKCKSKLLLSSLKRFYSVGKCDKSQKSRQWRRWRIEIKILCMKGLNNCYILWLRADQAELVHIQYIKNLPCNGWIWGNTDRNQNTDCGRTQSAERYFPMNTWEISLFFAWSNELQRFINLSAWLIEAQAFVIVTRSQQQISGRSSKWAKLYV